MTGPRTLPAPELRQLSSLFQARRFDAMEQLARKLVAQYPDAGMAWKALGIALQAQGMEAVGALQKALALLPEDAELAASLVEAHLGQGHALMKSGRAEEAAACYGAAQGLNPRHAHAHACLGVAMQELGQLEAAVQSFRQAVSLRPDLVDAQFCLGSNLLALGRAEEALQSLQCVLALNPEHGRAHANLGNAFKALGRMDEALGAYRRAIELQPDVPLNHANLAAAHRDLGEMQKALDGYQRVLDLAPTRLAAFSDRLFIRNYLGGGTPGTPSERTAEARRFGALAAAQARPYTQWHSNRHVGADARPAERLRVGFVSADLREHPIGYFAEGVMAALSSSFADHIELFVYANTESTDALTTRLQAHCHRWVVIAGLDDEAAAARIHADGLDILIDLSGHTAGNRLPLFAWKPAPLQITWLGDCATTGVGAIDYFLADPWVAPPGADAEFTEKVWRLPETFLCFTPPAMVLDAGPLPAMAAGHITFGCFNKVAKLNDDVVATWARVLQAVPGSRLFLKSGLLGTEPGRQHLRDRFAKHGIGRERLILEGASPREDYLRAYRRVDMALDPFPYPGGTTSVEGLWMGVPVLTLAGSCALARQGESILHNLGLPDWIATDVDDYVARAARHAGDLQALAATRQKLRPQFLGSPLCDGHGFAKHFAAALVAMDRQAQNPRR
ncbi:tetratricopeptide repeat protein [soil metagenome]